MKKEVAILIKDLKALNFSKAKYFILKLKQELSPKDLKEIIYLTSDEENGVGILTYTFLIEFFVDDDNQLIWNEVARDILANNLCHLKFAYSAALIHAKKVCELDRTNIAAWELFLDIGANRSKILDDKSINYIALRILELDPSNSKGRIYLNK